MKQVVFCLLLSSICALLPQTAHLQAQASLPAKELFKRGELLMSRNRVDEAIESYSRAIELSPNYADAYVNRGIAKRAKGDLKGCVEDYEKAAAINPKSIAGNRFVAQAYSNRGFIKLGDFDVEGAIQDFTKAINIEPNEADHYYKRGQSLLLNGDLEESLKDLDKALTLINAYQALDKVLIYATRGMVKFVQGKEAEGQKDIDEARRLNKTPEFDVDGYLWSLEGKLELMRQLRLRKQRSIA